MVGVEGAVFEDSAPASHAPIQPPGATAPHGCYWNAKLYTEARNFAAGSSFALGSGSGC